MNVAPITRSFKDIAKFAIDRMDNELAAGQGPEFKFRRPDQSNPESIKIYKQLSAVFLL